MPRPLGQSCNSCTYWVQDPLLSQEQGLCCRYPPGRLGSVGRGNKTFSSTAFPLTSNSDWCGEYREGPAQGTSPDEVTISQVTDKAKAQAERLQEAISKAPKPK